MSGALVTLYEMYNQYSLWLSTLTGGKAKGHWLWVKTNSKLSQSVLAYCHWQEKRCTGYGYCHNQYSHTVTDRRKRCTGYGYCHNQYLHTVTDRRKGALVMGTVTINTRILSLTGEKVYWLWVLSQSVLTCCHFHHWQEARSTEWNINCHYHHWQEVRSIGYEWSINCHNQYSHTVTISTDRRQGVKHKLSSQNLHTVTITTDRRWGALLWVKHKLTVSTPILSLSVLIGGEEYWLWMKHKLSQSVLTYCHYQCWQEARSTVYEYCHNQYPHTIAISADRRHGVLVMNTVSISTHILSLSVLTRGKYWLWVKHKLSQSVLPCCRCQHWQEARSIGST